MSMALENEAQGANVKQKGLRVYSHVPDIFHLEGM